MLSSYHPCWTVCFSFNVKPHCRNECQKKIYRKWQKECWNFSFILFTMHTQVCVILIFSFLSVAHTFVRSFIQMVLSLSMFTYSWYHFLSRYFAISWCAAPLNCCASFDILSALSSNLFNLSPRSIINWWARLTSLDADVARLPKSCIWAFGPEINFATERFGLPLTSPTVDQQRKKLWAFRDCYCSLDLHNSSRSMLLVPPPKSPTKKLAFGASGISHCRYKSPSISL